MRTQRCKAMAVIWSSILAAMTIAMAGCGSIKDVSHDPFYLGQMAIGRKYLLRTDTFLWDVNYDRLPIVDQYPVTPGYWLVMPGQETGWYGRPLPSVEQWQNSGGPWGIKGVVKIGTVLSLSHITYYNFIEGDTEYYVFTIVDGPYRGREVCLNDLLVKRSGVTPEILTAFPK